jgi:type I site-specific restriction endonuclease
MISRKTSVTAESLQAYRQLIKTATDDLEAHLASIDEKLETVFARTATDSETAELRHMQEERSSTQQCLLICAQLSEHISQIQLKPTIRSRESATESAGVPERIAGGAMQECKLRLNQASAKLEEYMHDVIDRLMSTTSMGQDDRGDLERLREEWSTARQCMDICSRADNNLKESISIIDNQAIGDETVQFLVSTNEKTIHGKNRGDGFRIRQIGGHFSDESLQQLSRDIATISSIKSGGEARESDTPPSTDEYVTEADRSEFQQRYGRGMKLASKSDPNTTIAPSSAHDTELESSQSKSVAGTYLCNA